MQLVPLESYFRSDHIFQPLDYHLAVPAALQGRSPAQLYADDPLRPRSALLCVQHHFFLAGSAGNEAFNEELYRLFEQTIFPTHPRDGFVLTWEDPAWEYSLQQAILRDYPPIPGPRQYYELRLNEPGALPANLPPLPEGLHLRAVDQELTEDPRLSNRDALLEELLSERPPVTAFLENSFGTCIVSDNRIITWCLSEYNLDRRCEVGIATDADYRGRGLATLTGLAFLLQAQQAGINQVGWHCWTRNEPSGKTALKIGLHKERDYPACFVLADRVANLAVHGEIALDRGEYQAAADWFARAFHYGEGPGWAYKNAACVYARLDDPETAFHYLDLAIEKGYDDQKDLEENEHLQSLRRDTQWSKMMARMRSVHVL